MARSVSRVTVALSIVSSVSQLFSFLVGCSGMILKGFSFVAFFAGVKTSSVCIHLSCLVCSLSVFCGLWSRLFCGHKGCNLPEVSITSFLHSMSDMKLLRLFRLLTENTEPSNANQDRTLPYLVVSSETHYTRQRRFLQQTGSAVKSWVFVPVTSNLGMRTRGQCGQPFDCTNKRGHDKE